MIKYLEDKIENKEGKNMLDDFVDRILEEGKKESLYQVATNMLKEKCDKAMIKRCTGLSEAKISKLEKSIQNV